MPTIALKKAHPGMQLISDVTDSNGMVLLKQGTTLTEKNISLLINRNILHVEIEGDEPNRKTLDLSTINPEVIEAAEREANSHFKHSDPQHPLNAELIKHWKNLYINRECGS